MAGSLLRLSRGQSHTSRFSGPIPRGPPGPCLSLTCCISEFRNCQTELLTTAPPWSKCPLSPAWIIAAASSPVVPLHPFPFRLVLNPTARISISNGTRIMPLFCLKASNGWPPILFGGKIQNLLQPCLIRVLASSATFPGSLCSSHAGLLAVPPHTLLPGIHRWL